MTPTIQNQEQKIQVKDLGIISYTEAYALQRYFVQTVIEGGAPVLLVCEHPAVLTLGRIATEKNILVAKEDLKNRGVELIHIDRGGEVTLHSPGQLVVYSILNLRRYGADLKKYLTKLEQVTIDLLDGFDIVARRIPGRTGVWVGEEKIASLGIGVRRWVSYHGLAINVSNALELFSLIKPCGLDVSVTSLARLKNAKIDMGLVKESFFKHFCRHFALDDQNPF